MNTESKTIPGLHGRKVNVNASERMVSVFAGGALAAYALRQRNWTAAALAAGGGYLVMRRMSGHCNVYDAAGVNSAEVEHKSRHTEQVTTIDASPEELYRFWRNFENLPKIMHYLESVQVLDDKRSVWRAKGPGDRTIEWTAEIVRDVPNERIDWRSNTDATVPNSGSVEFRRATGDRGTVVRVAVDYQPPAGRIGLGLAKLSGKTPGSEIREDLRRFKQMMETGVVSSTEGQSAGPRSSMLAPFSVPRRVVSQGDVRIVN